MDVLTALKQSPLLRGFTDDGVRIIQAATTLRRLPAGAPIFVEQMHGESAFLLADGQVSLFLSRGGVEKELAVLSAPDSFGELSLLSPGPRRISAKAKSDVVLLEIPRRDFMSLQKQRPQACLKLLINIVDGFGTRATGAAGVIELLTAQL